jgi:hypothetical protein
MPSPQEGRFDQLGPVARTGIGQDGHDGMPGAERPWPAGLPRPASAGPGRTDKTIEPSLGLFPDLHRRDRAAQVEDFGLPSTSRPVSAEAWRRRGQRLGKAGLDAHGQKRCRKVATSRQLARLRPAAQEPARAHMVFFHIGRIRRTLGGVFTFRRLYVH